MALALAQQGGPDTCYPGAKRKRIGLKHATSITTGHGEQYAQRMALALAQQGGPDTCYPGAKRKRIGLKHATSITTGHAVCPTADPGGRKSTGQTKGPRQRFYPRADPKNPGNHPPANRMRARKHAGSRLAPEDGRQDCLDTCCYEAVSQFRNATGNPMELSFLLGLSFLPPFIKGGSRIEGNFRSYPEQENQNLPAPL